MIARKQYVLLYNVNNFRYSKSIFTTHNCTSISIHTLLLLRCTYDNFLDIWHFITNKQCLHYEVFYIYIASFLTKTLRYILYWNLCVKSRENYLERVVKWHGCIFKCILLFHLTFTGFRNQLRRKVNYKTFQNTSCFW